MQRATGKQQAANACSRELVSLLDQLIEHQVYTTHLASLLGPVYKLSIFYSFEEPIL
jgi:hypothetical protein